MVGLPSWPVWGGNVEEISSPISTFDLKAISYVQNAPDPCDDGTPLRRVPCDGSGFALTWLTPSYSEIGL
jgi:hypothetical protein